jgi:hypothetical protein
MAKWREIGANELPEPPNTLQLVRIVVSYSRSIHIAVVNLWPQAVFQPTRNDGGGLELFEFSWENTGFRSTMAPPAHSQRPPVLPAAQQSAIGSWQLSQIKIFF